MKIIYCQGSLNRRKEFQVITTIFEDSSGRRFVRKRAACEEAITHIEQMYKNESLLKESHGRYVVGSQFDRKEIVTPYIEGVTIGKILRQALINDDRKNIGSTLEIWKEILIGNEDNICEFYQTPEFRQVFGDSIFYGEMATRYSNFDCIGENLIFVADGSIASIDLEWVFNFPIPVELNWYRVLKEFVKKNDDVCSCDKLYQMAGINSAVIPVYENAIERFYQYVYWDQERNIDYARYGRYFLTPAIKEKLKKGTYKYKFPKDVWNKYNHILIYGAGKVGFEFASYIKENDELRLAGWVDKRALQYRVNGMLIDRPENIVNISYDILLIAVVNEAIANEIKSELDALGVDKEKVYWSRPELA